MARARAMPLAPLPLAVGGDQAGGRREYAEAAGGDRHVGGGRDLAGEFGGGEADRVLDDVELGSRRAWRGVAEHELAVHRAAVEMS